MSFARFALRTAALHALRGQTLVGDNVRDSDFGAIDVGAQLEIVQETPASIHLDAHFALGPIAATEAVRLASTKAEEVGIEPAPQAHDRRAQHEGLQPEAGDRLAGRRGGRLILANGAQHAAPGRGVGALDQEIHPGDEQCHDHQIGERAIQHGVGERPLDPGASAPAPTLYEKFGITAEAVAEKVRALL